MKKSLGKRTEKGLTLIESLVGIMVVATVVTLITPALVVGYATRIKNYRTDQAIKLAKGEIDRVRLEVDRGNIKSADFTPQLPPTPPSAQTVQDFDIDRVPAPTAVPVGTTPPPCPLLNVQGTTPVTSVCSLDINGDGEWDLGMQTFRSATPTDAFEAAYNKPVAFLMRVRVYTKAALTASPNQLKPFPDLVATTRDRKTASLGLTSGANISLPLVTLSSSIIKSDLDISRSAYCELIRQDRSQTGTSGGLTCN